MDVDPVDTSIDGALRAEYNTKKIQEDLLPDLPSEDLPYESTQGSSNAGGQPVYQQEDVFSPSSTPAQVAKPNQVNSSQNITQQKVQTGTAVSNKPTQNVSKPSQVPSSTIDTYATPAKNINNKQTAQTTKNSSSIVVRKGKKFRVRLAQSVSSSTPVNTRLTFKSIYPETSRYATIPAGTVFKGRVEDSHYPQITGNGGLIVISVDQMVYKGRTYEIDGKISVANGKHIFFNNIKGQRMYLRSIPKAMKPGNTYFKKMWKVTKNLARNDSGVEIILTPFSFISGTVVWVVNFAVAPVLAIFYKGKSITIPANSQFTIQLKEDLYL